MSSLVSRMMLGAALLLLGAAPVRGQNLIVNPELDSVVAPWTIGSQEFVLMGWSPVDVDGSLVSGSLSLESQFGSAYQCVAIVPGATYLLGGFVAPLSANRTGVVNHSLELEWYATTGCSGFSPLGRDALPAPTILDVWHEVEGYIAAPPTAQSARVHLQNRWLSGGFATALYDSLYVPEPGLGVGLALGLLGLAAGDRRRRARPVGEPIASLCAHSPACARTVLHP